MSKQTCALNVWASEMSRALHVLSYLQRCQASMQSVKMMEHQGRGTHLQARINVSGAERGSLERRIDNIVGVVQARLTPETDVPHFVPQNMDWMSVAERGARYR